MGNLNALIHLAKKYGIDQSEIDEIVNSKQIKITVTDRNGEEISEANWALSKCKEAYHYREAVDPRMLVKALPKINSTQVLKKFHDQIEDINLDYRELEPIYVKFVEIAKTFQASFEYFEKIHFDNVNYRELLYCQLQLAKNTHAIDAVGQIGKRYYETLDVESGINHDMEEYIRPMHLVKWNSTIVSRILDCSRTYKEAISLLPYIIENGKFISDMEAIGTTAMERMLKLVSNPKQAEACANQFPINKDLKSWIIKNALKSI